MKYFTNTNDKLIIITLIIIYRKLPVGLEHLEHYRCSGSQGECQETTLEFIG